MIMVITMVTAVDLVDENEIDDDEDDDNDGWIIVTMMIIKTNVMVFWLLSWFL